MTRVWLFVLALVLTGCASIPPSPPSALPQDGRGRVVLRPFYVPQGAGNNAIAAFLGGGTSAIHIPLYDVTGEPRFLGVLKSQGARVAGGQESYEYDVPPGTRVLMLYMRKFGGGDFVDFVEVPVAANQVEHVALSQYGMNDRPFFARIPLTPEAARFCLQAPNMPAAEMAKELKARGVEGDNYRPDYCRVLGFSIFRVAPVSADWQGPLTRDHVARLKERYLEKWRKMTNRMPPYDLE